MSEEPTEEQAGTWPRVLVVLVLILGTLAIYFPVTGYSFVNYDDPNYVYNNYHLRNGFTWNSLRWAFTSTDYQYNWHPLTWISHLVDIELFGFVGAKHHGTNLALHIFSGFLLLGALRALRFGFWGATFVTAVFLWHPLRVESVAWISERKDLLSGLFWMAGLWAYGNYVETPSRKRLLTVLVALALGLMSKSMVVTLPFVLLLLDVWPLGRWKSGADMKGLVREKAPLFVLVALVCILTVYTQREGGAIAHELSLIERLLHIPHAITHYLATTFWPVGLCAFYPHPRLVAPESTSLAVSLGLALLYVGFSLVVWRARRSWPEVFLGWFWFLGTLVPVIGIVQVGDQAYADRYMYLPGIGIAIALLALPRLVKLNRVATLGIATAVLLAANLRARDQVGYWENSPALWERALALTERNAVAHTNMGELLAKSGQLPKAGEHFEAALEVDPRSYHALINLGYLHLVEGEFEEARIYLDRALEVAPDNALAHLYSAMNFLSLKEWKECERHLDRANELDPRIAGHKFYIGARNHLLKQEYSRQAPALPESTDAE